MAAMSKPLCSSRARVDVPGHAGPSSAAASSLLTKERLPVGLAEVEVGQQVFTVECGDPVTVTAIHLGLSCLFWVEVNVFDAKMFSRLSRGQHEQLNP